MLPIHSIVPNIQGHIADNSCREADSQAAEDCEKIFTDDGNKSRKTIRSQILHEGNLKPIQILADNSWIAEPPKWQSLLSDFKSYSFANHISRYIHDTSYIIQQLEELPWSCPFRKQTRESVWMVDKSQLPICECTYPYSNVEFSQHPMPPWMRRLAAELANACQLPLPNCCNANRYWKCSDLVYHSDDEPLFGVKNVNIISVSVGSARTFGIKHNITGEFKTIRLQDGDVMTMTGDCQAHYKHSIFPSDKSAGDEPRYNLTFRFLSSHNAGCPHSS